jgi:hypothetical protein
MTECSAGYKKLSCEDILLKISSPLYGEPLTPKMADKPNVRKADWQLSKSITNNIQLSV